MSDLEAFGMTFTESEIELIRKAKANGRSLADVFSQPPFIADGIRKMQAAMGEDGTVVSVTDERFIIIADLIERIATHINVPLVGHGRDANLSQAAAFCNSITKLRTLATTPVRP